MLYENVKSFVQFSIAFDECKCTDTINTSLLALFISGISDNMNVTEELLHMMPISRTTTGNDLYMCIEKSIKYSHTDTSKLLNILQMGLLLCWCYCQTCYKTSNKKVQGQS